MSPSNKRLASLAVAPGRFVRNTSIATRLALVVLLVAIGSLLVTSLVALDTGEELADGIADARLTAARSSKAAETQIVLDRLSRQTSALALSPMSSQAIRQFSSAYRELEQIDAAEQEAERRELLAYYRSAVIPPLERMRGQAVGVREIFPVSPAAIHLQRNYSSSSLASTGREASVDDAGDGSRWTSVHKRLHPTFRNIVRATGAADAYLIDSHGTVVYSTEKDIDLGTNLQLGTSSGSTLARLAGQVAASDGEADGGAVFTDMAPYFGAADAPVGFVAAPVRDGDTTVGVVALRFTPAEFTNVLTSGGDWQAQGLGESGEVYAVGRDGGLRSEARAFLDDRDAYLDAAEAAGSIDDDDRRRIVEAETSVFFQRVSDSSSVDAAELPNERFEATSYVGEPIAVVAQPLEANGLEWLIVAQAGADEIDKPIANFVSDLIVGTAVFVVILVFLAVVWAGRLVEPIRIISRRLRRAHGVETAGELDLPADGPLEFTTLAANFDSMLSKLGEREAAVEAAHDERRDFLERFLPPSVARRVGEGDRDVVDRVPNATVVVLLFRGLSALMERRDSRDLIDRAIDEADRIAALHGLERLKLTANAYVAACGVSRPFLDQAPRSVAFATDAIDAWQEIADDSLPAGAGVHTGTVIVGLAGANRLVYDAWGPAIVAAQRLAQRAGAGEVLVAAETRKQLPEDLSLTPAEGEHDEQTWSVVHDAGIGAS